MGHDIPNGRPARAVALAELPKVISIDQITDAVGVRSDLAQSLDSTYEAVNACAKAFMNRGNQKVAARLALVSLAVLAATHDGEWGAMCLHYSEEAAISMKRACQAAHAAISLMFMVNQEDQAKLQQGEVVLNCLAEAIEKADKAGIR